ncbi:glycerol-3-phosphate acyltransferase [Trichocoleus sp. FACHB-591]|uniref:glycerol-3-phosphate acyltransferase n=1 Tax=Trichocoleus sp. FACHB-591 TaxID=2692872 RepID=UPI001689BB92|nr:glycerol-3-phosphate acyltransferase [Trichocoleus sp. FACHB-591]MBD2094752.1 glycerol-3-phosphate acyltransferase [Trichocoleus sp. FACHB-591]
MNEVLGALIICIGCPLLGGLPLISWLTYALTRKQLAKLGTGNVSVSAAFYHGGRVVGILAVLSEAFKGIAAVLIARYFFPQASEWELISLIALVMGRYWMARGAGTTNVVWGYVVHDWMASLLVFILGGIGSTILREKRQGKILVLVLFPLITALLHPQESALIVAAIVLGSLMGWIYRKIPDDLDLTPEAGQPESQAVFKFFRGDRALVSLNRPLEAQKVGQKAATLSQLMRWGYPVPVGWVLPPGDDPTPLIEFLQPSSEKPLVVRSSAVGEDSELASAAGQYESILNVTTQGGLERAIAQCLASYDQPGAIQYRRDRGLPEAAMAILVQQQIRGAFSGVAFSRDPIARQGEAVVIEALPGETQRIVSGQFTPEQYRVLVRESDLAQADSNWVLPADLELPVEGTGDLPPRLIQQVAFLARHLEARYHGLPQDIEWTYDGQTLWLLQSRPITTLLPIWTRKIAAEVIPGLIRPLTWSINRPLTCGVWGEIFTLVLGKRSRGLDFNETATLHHSRAYFNASLLGQTFLRMGLPPESLEFLTRGAKFSKPPLGSTLGNTPGLMRLLQREWQLDKDFRYDYQRQFAPLLTTLTREPAENLTAPTLLERIDTILRVLKRATYYSILAPLSAALRQAILKVQDSELDNSNTPEVAALRSLQEIANRNRHLVANLENPAAPSPEVFDTLAARPNGQTLSDQLAQFLDTYGYLSEVGTDIAVPTWREDSKPVCDLFTQFLLNPTPAGQPLPAESRSPAWKVQRVQQRVSLKGQVTEIYSRLLAELRWSFVALEKLWLEQGLLSAAGDIFFLKFEEIWRLIQQSDADLASQVSRLIAERRSQLAQDNELVQVPALVYGNAPLTFITVHKWQPSQKLQGIGASPGQVEGRVKVLRSLQAIAEIDRETILVVPYTDSGWAPLLARAGGLIAEVGGRLSHGAIVAREYGIPAVMDVHDATHQLQDGQWVRIDGQQGTVEVL